MLSSRYLTALIPTGSIALVATWQLSSHSWSAFGVEPMQSMTDAQTSFADLANITFTADCLREGTPLEGCDPYGRSFQPYVVMPARILAWLHLGSASTNMLGLALTVVFVFTVALLGIWIAHQWKVGVLGLTGAQVIFAGCCVTPPMVLAIERGQLEFVTLACVTSSLLLLSSSNVGARCAGAVLGNIAVLSKFFPVGLWAPFIRRGKPNWPALAGLLVTVLFTVFTWATLTQSTSTARADLPATSKSQFGSANLVATALTPSPVGYTPSDWVIDHWQWIRLMGWVTYILVTLLMWLYLRYSATNMEISPQGTRNLLLGGAGVIVVPYLLGSSHDYREMFLLPVVAAGLVMVQQGPSRPVAITFLAGCFATLVTGSAMVPTDSGFLWPKAAMIIGDVGLLAVLTLATALWLNGLQRHTTESR